MVFGLPTEEVARPTFYFDRVVSWALHDREGSPWDWANAPLVDTTRDPVQAICAYEFFSPLGRQGESFTEVGNFTPTTLVVTMMEADFEEVVDCSYVTVGNSELKWWFRYYRPTYALSALPVFQIHFVSEGAR
jgi:hypothetical protein